MNEKKEIINSNNEKVEAEILAYIENTKTNKDYIYYTLNETVGVGPSSTVKIYVSKMRQGDIALDTPITDEDWDMLKSVMSDSIKGTISETIKYLPLSGLTDNTSISDRAIAMPISYDYINKQKEIYSKNVVQTPEVKVEEPVPEQPVETPVAPVTPEMPSTPVEPETKPIEEPIVQPTEQVPVQDTLVVTPVEEPVEDSTTDSSESTTGRSLEPIDITEIETKYASMIDALNDLKEKEIEAAKRYNATLELTSMHNEQHASYVQNDIKENAQSVTNNEEVIPTIEPTPIVNPGIVEPTPVTPVVPDAPVTNATPSDIETNWFDMPNN